MAPAVYTPVNNVNDWLYFVGAERKPTLMDDVTLTRSSSQIQSIDEPRNIPIAP